jgi:hypothetical protein
MIRHDRISSLRLYVLIFLTAVTVRSTLAAVTYRPAVAYKGEAESIGASLAQKGEFAGGYTVPTGPTAHCGPFYTSLIASIYCLFGVTPKAEFVRIALLIAVNSACCALLPYVGSTLGLPRWAYASAGFAAALIPMHRTAEIFHAWDEPYAAAGLMLAIAGLNSWTGLRENRARSWAAFGLWWGLLLHIMVTILPVYIGLAAIDTGLHRSRQRASCWLVAFGLTSLALVPWTVRNRLELGHWFLIRSNLGIELRMSFGEGTGVTTQDIEKSGHYRNFHPGGSKAVAAALRDEGEINYNRRLTREAAAWIHHHPEETTRLIAARAGKFWLGDWQNPETAWAFALSTMLALAGAWWMWRDGRTEALLQLGCVVLLFHPIYCIVAHVPRYRVPVWWCMLLLAAYGAGRTWQWAIGRREAGES